MLTSDHSTLLSCRPLSGKWEHLRCIQWQIKPLQRHGHQSRNGKAYDIEHTMLGSS